MTVYIKKLKTTYIKIEKNNTLKLKTYFRSSPSRILEDKRFFNLEENFFPIKPLEDVIGF